MYHLKKESLKNKYIKIFISPRKKVKQIINYHICLYNPRGKRCVIEGSEIPYCNHAGEVWRDICPLRNAGPRCVTRVPVALCVSPLHSKQRKEELLHVAVLHNTKQGILVSYNNDYITKIVFIVQVRNFLFNATLSFCVRTR